MVVEIDPRDVVSVPLDCEQQKLRTAKYKVVAHFEKKLEEPMCDDYGDYDNWEWEDKESSDESYDDGFNAGYEAAKQDLVKFAQKRDANGRFTKA